MKSIVVYSYVESLENRLQKMEGLLNKVSQDLLVTDVI